MRRAAVALLVLAALGALGATAPAAMRWIEVRRWIGDAGSGDLNRARAALARLETADPWILRSQARSLRAAMAAYVRTLAAGYVGTQYGYPPPCDDRLLSLMRRIARDDPLLAVTAREVPEVAPYAFHALARDR